MKHLLHQQQVSSPQDSHLPLSVLVAFSMKKNCASLWNYPPNNKNLAGMVTPDKTQTVNDSGCRVATPSLLLSVVMKGVLASVWQVFWSRLRRQTLVTEKPSPNLNTQHSLKVHVWCFSFGGGKEGRAGGKENTPELGGLGLNALRAFNLVSGDQLQHLVIFRCNSWSVGLLEHSTEVITKGR